MKTYDKRYTMTEDINGVYCYLNYAGFNIIKCKRDGYLNMTKVVDKDLRQWLAEHDGTIKAIEKELGSNQGPPFYSVTSGPNEFRGIYCHKLLVPHILSWGSDEFTAKVSKVVNMYYEHSSRSKHKELMETINTQYNKLIYGIIYIAILLSVICFVC